MTDPMQSGSLLVEYWETLYRRKGVILIATAVAAVLANFASRFEGPVYRARASVETLKPGNTLTIKNDWDIPTRSSAYQIRRTIQKRDLLNQVAAKVRAHNLGRWPKRHSMAKNYGIEEPSLDDALAMAASSLKVRETSAAGIVNVLCDSPDAALAAEFANTLVEEYIQENLKTRWAGAQYDSAWVDSQLQELKARMRLTGVQLEQYARETVLLSGGKDSLAFHQLNEIKQRVLKTRTEREKRQLRYELAERTDADSLSRILQDNDLATMEFDLVQLQGEQATLLHKFLPDHAAARKMQSRIDQRQAAVNEGRAHLLERVTNEYESAVNIEKALAESYDHQARIVSGGSNQSVAYAILQQEMDNDLSAYESLLGQSKLGAVITAVMAPNLRVVDFAEPPRKPYTPNVQRNVISGIINSLFLSAALVLLKESVNRVLRVPGDISRSLGIPELACIPANRERNSLLCWQEDPEFAEAYRTCAENIVLRQRKAPVIAISSPRRGEERAVAAVHIGMALAEMQRSVLLIDADARAPRLHQFFELSNDRGFAEAVGESSNEGIALATAVPRLSVIPAGRRRLHVGHLLRNETRIQALLRWANEKYDVVLVVAPALLNGPDARVLARYADSAVLVFRAGRATRADGMAAADRLARDGRHVLGAVLTECSKKALRESDGYARPTLVGGVAARWA